MQSEAIYPVSYSRSAAFNVDIVYRGLVAVSLLLSIVVFVEPAPADALLMLALAAGLLFGRLSFRNVTAAPVIALSIFLIANLMSLPAAQDTPRAIVYIAISFYLVLSCFLFFGLIGYYGDRYISEIVKFYTIAGIISALLGIGGYFHLLPFTDLLLLNGRSRGLFKDCNVYGPYFIPMALFSITRVLDDTSRLTTRVFNAVSCLLASIAIFLSFSRACWFNYAVSLVMYFALQFIRIPRQEIFPRLIQIAGTITLTGVMIATSLKIPAVESMMAQRVTANGLQSYDRVRFATQALALETAKQSPLGIGAGQAEPAFIVSTHSMYLRILVENGFLGLGSFLAFLFIALRRSLVGAFRAKDLFSFEVNSIVAACIVGHLVNSIVIDTVHWRHIWVVLAFPWLASNREL